MLKYLISILITLSFTQLKGQVPMNKDSLAGVNEMLNIMTTNGFNFYKSESYPGRHSFIKLRYKEEVVVDIFFNEFNNINSIAIRTSNDAIVDKIKDIVDYDSWEYCCPDERKPERSVYRYNDHFCQYAYNEDYRHKEEVKHCVHQFLHYR